MKKLIALLSSVAIVASFSFSAMAATSSTTYNAQTDTFVTTVTADVGDQATLLAFPGTQLGTDPAASISFIDQQTTTNGATEFTYKMKTTPTAGQLYTIKVGGSLLTTPLSETITPIEVTAPTTYTITGTVANVAAAANSDNYIDLWDYPEQLESMMNNSNLAWKTNITLIPASDLHLLVKSYIDGGEYTETSIATAQAEVGTGNFTLTVPALASGITSANYVIVVRRAGYTTFLKKVTFENANKSLDNNINLIPGDVIDNSDLEVGGGDVRKICDNLNDYSSGQYLTALDLDSDGAVGGSDLRLVVDNLGVPYSVEYLADGIDFDDLRFNY